MGSNADTAIIKEVVIARFYLLRPFFQPIRSKTKINFDSSCDWLTGLSGFDADWLKDIIRSNWPHYPVYIVDVNSSLVGKPLKAYSL